MKRIFFAAFTIIVGWQLTLARDFSGPWNMKALSVAPKVNWGVRSNLVQEVFYEGEPFNGHPAHVFAYVARPEGLGPFPAIVLVHGGGGKAFYDWADH